MSPESLNYNRISKESDVWSYGILLWEIYTYGCTPYPSLPLEHILEKLISGYRMEKPADCDPNVYDTIMLACWHIEPKQRPKFAQIIQLFENLLHENPVYADVNALVEKQKLTPLTTTNSLAPPEHSDLSKQSSSNLSECSTEQTHTNLSNYSTLSNSSCNNSSSSSSTSSHRQNHEQQNDTTRDDGQSDVKEIIPFLDETQNGQHKTSGENATITRTASMLKIAFTMADEKSPPTCGGLKTARQQFINLFSSSNSMRKNKSNLLNGQV